MNQNSASDAKSTPTIGTTMAGMRVLRFEEDLEAAVVLVAAAEVVVVVGWAVVEDDRAAADVIEAYSDESVMVLVLVVTVVEMVLRLDIDCTKVSVSVTVVKPDGAWAVASGAEGSAVATVGPIDCGRVAVGLPMLAGKLLIS